MTREQFVMAEIIALEDARRMAATLQAQAEAEADERIKAAVQLPGALPDGSSSGTDQANPVQQKP